MSMVAALSVAGCAGKGSGLDASGRPVEEGGGAGTALTPDFSSIQDQIFTPICTTCHAGGGAPQGLRLDAVNSYNLLVGIASTEVLSILRVRPGDPDNSYLIQKLEGHAAVGARMPLGFPPLSTEQIAAIRQWIVDGAQRPTMAAAGASFDIAATVPSADEVVSAPPQIVVGFNHEVDATRLFAQSLRLEREIENGSDIAFESVPAPASLPSANPMAVVLTPADRLPDGHYRLLIPADAIGISDQAGHELSVSVRTAAGDGLIVEFDVETVR